MQDRPTGSPLARLVKPEALHKNEAGLLLNSKLKAARELPRAKIHLLCHRFNGKVFVEVSQHPCHQIGEQLVEAT